MKFLGQSVILSESTRRNLYMAPGILLIATGMLADACSPRRVTPAISTSKQIKTEVVAVKPLVQAESGLRIE